MMAMRTLRMQLQKAQSAQPKQSATQPQTVRMHPKQPPHHKKRTPGTSEDRQQQLPPLSSRLLEIAAINFYDEQSNADQTIEEICHCAFFQSLTKANMPHHTDAIDDFPTTNDTIGATEERRDHPIDSKTSGTAPTNDISCCKRSCDEGDEDNDAVIDEATVVTAATEDCSFTAWDVIDLPHSLSTTISTSPLQPSTKLLQRYSNSSSGSLSSGTPNKPIGSSSASSSTSGPRRRKVSFLAGYVSEVHVQPRVSAEDWSKVFYSPREIQLMWDDFLREGLGRVDILISEEEDVAYSGNQGAPIIVEEVLEDEADCGLCYSESESDDDGTCDNGASFAKAEYQSQSGRRRRPRANASADTLLAVGERRT